jgi:hypothetical protein
VRRRLTKLFAGLAAVSALAFGGATLAGAASKQTPPAPPAASAPAGLADTIQQGDQRAPDPAGQESAGETPESATESASESSSEVPGNDGPGGHADEPGDPNADNQFEGQQ